MSGIVPPCIRQVWSRKVITFRVVFRSTRRIRKKRRTWGQGGVRSGGWGQGGGHGGGHGAWFEKGIRKKRRTCAHGR